MSIARFIVVLLVSVVLSGCATIIRGTIQDIPVSSNPSGANIIVDGMMYSKTPATIQIHRGHPHQLTLELDGYQPYHISLRSNMGKAIAGNFCIGGIPGMAVDAFSGAANSLSPDAIHAELVYLDGVQSPPSPTRAVVIRPPADNWRPSVFLGVVLVTAFSGVIIVEGFTNHQSYTQRRTHKGES